ncbi:MFS transporter [Candidatus Woesearchaeota archaeon]|nr:MFS transporter [Candidatus Woesearchaeota archaeon]
MEYKKEYITIFVIMITEVLGFSLILPFLPYYVENFGASPLTYGLILASFSFLQLISSPIMGKLSDHYGRRPMLFFSQLSTFISFIILGLANSLLMVFLSRIVDGLLGSNMTLAQAYISDISTKENRSRAFGLVGVAFGIGFLIGPAIGGTLARIDYSIPSFIAAGFSFITIITTYFFLPETVKRKKDIKFDFKKAFHINEFKKYFHNKKISSKLFQFFSYTLTHSIYVTAFAYFASLMFGFKENNIGYLLTYIGFLSIILRGVLLGKLIDIFGEFRLRYAGVFSIFIGMVMLSFLQNIIFFYIAMTLFAVGSGLSMPLLAGEISRNVSEKEQGAISGVRSSLRSISQIIGPLIGNAMINYFYPGSLGIAAGAVISVAIILMIKEDFLQHRNFSY